MADPFRVERAGRFQDFERGQSVVTEYPRPVAPGSSTSTADPIDKKFIKRQLKPLKKYGVPQQLSKLKGMSDAEMSRLAAKAILKKRGVGRKGGLSVKPMNTTVNREKYNIPWAKSVAERKAAGKAVPQKALRKTKPARQHLMAIRRNRRVMNTKFWSGKGYDAYKGYT